MNPDLPPDPFHSNPADLTEFAANVRNMHVSLVAAGFNDAEALEITVRFLTSMIKKLWAGIKITPMITYCKRM